MTDRPVLMSAPMVRALLDRRKTQTRRLAWRPLKGTAAYEDDGRAYFLPSMRAPTIWQSVRPGDGLWVRENHAFVGGGDPGLLLCEADWRETAERLHCENIPDKHPRWAPSIHMPRWASRLTLLVTAARMERVQEIDGIAALAEGIDREEGTAPWRMFCRLWKSLHTKPGTRWEDNPEVVAVTFRPVLCNIDAMAEAA